MSDSVTIKPRESSEFVTKALYEEQVAKTKALFDKVKVLTRRLAKCKQQRREWANPQSLEDLMDLETQDQELERIK